MVRQDSQDNQDFIFAFPEERQKTSYLFEVKRSPSTNKRIMQKERHPLLISQSFLPLKRNCVFSASSGSREKIKLILLILSENIFGLIFN